MCLVTAGADGVVNLLDADTLSLISSHKEQQPIECLLVDPKNSYVGIGVDSRAQVRTLIL